MSTGSPPISVQLYSVRDQAAKDFEGVLRSSARSGSSVSRLAGFHDLTPAQYPAILEESGLVTSSAHLGDLAPDALNAMLDNLQEIGCDTAVCAFMPAERFADLDAVKASAEALNNANEIARSRGVSLGYHNHWWEFATNLDGQTAWSALFEAARPDGVRRARHLLGDLGRRRPAPGHRRSRRSTVAAARQGRAVRCAGEVRWSPSGRAPSTFPPSSRPRQRRKWHIVELDRCATDMFAALADSLRVSGRLGLSRGRA
jgi:hypothetical protein